jgi:hypothetical protein
MPRAEARSGAQLGAAGPEAGGQIPGSCGHNGAPETSTFDHHLTEAIAMASTTGQAINIDGGMVMGY